MAFATIRWEHSRTGATGGDMKAHFPSRACIRICSHYLREQAPVRRGTIGKGIERAGNVPCLVHPSLEGAELTCTAKQWYKRWRTNNRRSSGRRGDE